MPPFECSCLRVSGRRLHLLAGDIPAALKDACEALRIARYLQTASSRWTEASDILLLQPGQSHIGCWQSYSLCLASLSQIGQLWDLLGSEADASYAFREGLELVGSENPLSDPKCCSLRRSHDFEVFLPFCIMWSWEGV